MAIIINNFDLEIYNNFVIELNNYVKYVKTKIDIRGVSLHLDYPKIDFIYSIKEYDKSYSVDGLIKTNQKVETYTPIVEGDLGYRWVKGNFTENVWANVDKRIFNNDLKYIAKVIVDEEIVRCINYKIKLSKSSIRREKENINKCNEILDILNNLK